MIQKSWKNYVFLCFSAFLIEFVSQTFTSPSTKCNNSSILPRLIVISLDGFMWNYLDYFGIKNFANFKAVISRGVHPVYVQNVYVPKTFPSHVTLATGLYQESHGILHNKMFDMDLKIVYKLGDKNSIWYTSMSNVIWLANQNAKDSRKDFCNVRRSGCVMYPTSDVVINGEMPYLVKSYNRSYTFLQRLDILLSWLTDPKEAINFGMLYHNDPDKLGHKFGPYSEEVFESIKELDSGLGYLLGNLNKAGILDATNIIITSDHGMSSVSLNKTVILSKYLDTSKYKAFGSTPIFHLLPQKGNHGYSHLLNESWPIFIAMGPAFKKNYRSSAIHSIDIYSLMCRILAIKPIPPNNGSMHRIMHLLAK